MQIFQCIISKRGVFSNKIIDFSDSFNFICGGNNSGKSLIIETVTDTLSNLRSCRSDIVYPDLNLNIILIFNNKKYQIIRSNETDFQVLPLEDIIEDAKINEDESNISDMVEIFDLVYRKRALYYSQKHINDYEIHELITACVDYSLKNNSAYYNQSKNFTAVYKNLSEKENNKITLKKLSLEKELSRSNKEMQILDIQISKKNKLTAEKNNLLKEISSLVITKNNLNDELKVLKKILKLSRKHNQHLKKKDKLQLFIENENIKKNEISQRKVNLTNEFSKLEMFRSLSKNALSNIQKAYSNIIEINEKISKKNIIDESITGNYSKMTIASAVVLLLSVLFYFDLVKIDLFSYVNKFFYLSLIVLSLSSGIYAITRYILCIRDKSLVGMHEEKQIIEKQFRQILLDNRIDLCDETITEIYELLLQYFEEYSLFVEKNEDIDEMETHLSDDKKYLSKNNKLITVTEKIHNIEENLIKLTSSVNRAFTYDVFNYPVDEANNIILAEISALNIDLEKVNSIINNIDEEILKCSEKEILLQETIKKNNILEKSLKELNDNHNAVGNLIDIFEQTNQAIATKYTETILEITKEIFSEMTNNQYNVQFDSTDIQKFFSAGYSESVLYMINLSLKLSLAEFLKDKIQRVDSNLPVIIDEPFQFMDDNSFMRFASICKKRLPGRQIIILTHSKTNFDEIGKVINI